MLKALHFSPTLFSALMVFAMLAAALVAGFILSRVFRRYATKFEKTWGELLFSLFESLPVPLLLLATLYTAIELFTLPPQWERIGSKLILALVILVLFYFPAKSDLQQYAVSSNHMPHGLLASPLSRLLQKW